MDPEEAEIKKIKIAKFGINPLYTKSKNSFCWKYFGNLILEKDGKKKHIFTDQVYCEECLKNAKEVNCDEVFGLTKIKTYSRNVSTGNLMRHLRDDHFINEPEKLVKGATNITAFFNVDRRQNTSKDAQGKKKWLLGRDLALWFCRSLIPFDSVDDDAMKDFFKKYNIICDESDLPTRTTISRDALNDVYDSVMARVNKLLSTEKCRYVAMTTDLWSDSYRRRNYITFSYHLVDENMTLRRLTLDTITILEKKTGERIKEEIQAVRARYGLLEKKVCLVTDSGSNIKKAASLVPGLRSHFCLGHGLHNLINTDGIDSTEFISNLIRKCKKIVKTLRYRAPELEAEADREQKIFLLGIEDDQASLGEEAEDSDSDSDDVEEPNKSVSAPTLKTATSTRWHSVLEMLESLAHPNNRGPINNLLGKLGKRREEKIDENEWKLIQQIVKLFKKLRDAVQILSSDLTSSLNVALVLRSEIKNVLNTSDDNESLIISTLKQNMLNALDHRFPVTPLLIAATLLDPRFQKIQEIDNYLENENMTRVTFMVNYANQMEITENDLIGKTSVSTNVQSPGSSSDQHKSASTLLLNLATKHTVSADMELQPLESEAWKYFCSTDVRDVVDGNIFKYWDERKNVYPWLHAMARAILCIPATSTPSEKIFSVAGLVLNAKRARLHPSRVNKIIFIHDNYNV